MVLNVINVVNNYSGARFQRRLPFFVVINVITIFVSSVMNCLREWIEKILRLYTRIRTKIKI